MQIFRKLFRTDSFSLLLSLWVLIFLAFCLIALSLAVQPILASATILALAIARVVYEIVKLVMEYP